MKYSTWSDERGHIAPIFLGVAHRSEGGTKSMPRCSTWQAMSSLGTTAWLRVVTVLLGMSVIVFEASQRY